MNKTYFRHDQFSAVFSLCCLVAACGDSGSNSGDKKEPVATDDGAVPDPTGPAVEPTATAPQATPEPTTSSEPAPTEPVVPVGETLGRFDLQVQPAMEATALADATMPFAVLSGKVLSAPRVDPTAWEKTLEEGDCYVQVPGTFGCEPACAAGEQCTPGGQCVAEPSSVSIGKVSVSGVLTEGGADPFEMSPQNPTTNAYNAYGDNKLKYPPFAEGDPIGFSAEGGAFAPFTIHASGIQALELTVDGAQPFVPGEPTELTWVAGDPSLAKILVTVDISHHGGTKGEIRCETDDDGSMEIPGALVTELVDLGVAGFPLVYVERRQTSVANVEGGHVDLNLLSRGERFLEIPGLVSCAGGVCADGQMCQQDLTCPPPVE